jgi:hypothetical protein
VATVAGIELPGDLPRLVAGARLRAALCAELGLLSPGPYSDYQRETLESFDTCVGLALTPLDSGEASAWIDFLRLKKRAQALEELRLEAGDVVEVEGRNGGDVREVSSIGSSGRVHFTGSGGGGAWPDMLSVRCRKGDDTESARELKREAANQAALRARTGEWSASKEQELRAYKVSSALTSENITQLEAVIESATDEKPIQQFIETCPQVLTALLGGKSRFCLPRVSLGGKYTADFFIGDVDSLGIRWILVELESPESNVTLKTMNDLDEHARRGVSQVREWREWLQNNLDLARRSKRRDGLGLVDIRPGSEGLVLVGRRTRLLEKAESVRNAIREESGIRVHTYDWLVEQITGVLRVGGPPGASPYILRHSIDDDDQWPDGVDDLL